MAGAPRAGAGNVQGGLSLRRRVCTVRESCGRAARTGSGRAYGEAGRAGLSRAGQQIHYPRFAGAASSGFVAWHIGYSGSGPLLVATEGSHTQETLGDLLPVRRTTLAPCSPQSCGSATSIRTSLRRKNGSENGEL